MPAQNRFSLKTLLLAVTLACVWFGAFAALARRMATVSSWKISASELFLWCILLATHSTLCAGLSKKLVLLATGSKSIQGPLSLAVFVLAFTSLIILSGFLGFLATLH